MGNKTTQTTAGAVHAIAAGLPVTISKKTKTISYKRNGTTVSVLKTPFEIDRFINTWAAKKVDATTWQIADKSNEHAIRNRTVKVHNAATHIRQHVPQELVNEIIEGVASGLIGHNSEPARRVGEIVDRATEATTRTPKKKPTRFSASSWAALVINLSRPAPQADDVFAGLV